MRIHHPPRQRGCDWGPIKRKEVQLVADADDFLQDVETAMEGQPPPEPEPEPDATAVEINTTGDVAVTVNGRPGRVRRQR